MTRTLRVPFLSFALAMVMMFAFALPAAADTHNGSVVADVLDESGEVVGEFTGDVALTEITRDGDQLLFSGTIVGEVRDEAGELITEVDTIFTGEQGTMAPGGNGNGNRACDILNLDLGPLDLNVLGLQVDLSDVQLDITAVPGAGNLLGNLLCAVAGLLDGPGLGGGIGNAIDNLLDRVTGILDGLLG
jgi:hypothetical protein